MPESTDWQAFFDSYAPRYMQEVFTRATVAEVDFLMELLALPPGSAILDIGCGTGRHSVELARRGYRVTGVDLSAGMLAEARRAAEATGVAVEWVQANAAEYATEARFNAAVCLCEGAFCLLGAEEDPITRDLALLRAVRRALKPGARFVMTALSAERRLRDCTPEDIAQGRFDPVTLVERSVMEWDAPEGRRSMVMRERLYVPTELALLLRLAGFQVEHLWGGTAGNWGRRPLDPDEMEIMAVARAGAQSLEPVTALE